MSDVSQQLRDWHGRFAGHSDPVTPPGVVFDISREDMARLTSIFPAMTPAHVAALGSCLPRSEVQISFNPTGQIIHIDTHGPYGESCRCLEKRSYGWVMENLSIKVPEFVGGTKNPARSHGIDLFINQVRAARAAGIQRLSCDAAGNFGADHNGYYTWPRFGYNCELRPPALREIAESPFGKAMAGKKMIQDLFALGPDARKWWQKNGRGWWTGKCTFDLSPDSPNSKTLAAYAAERGRHV